MLKDCSKHGRVEHVLRSGRKNSYRCKKCTSEAVTKHRKKKRALLVKEAGGKCIICGYNKYIGALQFHHLDPTTKEIGLSSDGQTVSLERLRQEASKCVLLCANCHVEVENSIIVL